MENTGNKQGKNVKEIRKKNLEKGKDTQFKPGQSGNPAGRPKLLLTEIREIPGFQRLSQSQLHDIIQDMMSLNLEQLEAVANHPASNVVIVNVALAIRQNMKDGNINTIETIASRVFGRANQKIQHEGIPAGNFKIEITRPKTDEEEEESEQQT